MKTSDFTHIAFIALGSNLSDPKKQILEAINAIAASSEMHLTKQSSLYLTSPVGYDNQPDFINAVVEIETKLTPLALLHRLFEIENSQGRERSFANAPRVLDLDLLIYENVIMNTTELNLPHPRMHERGFVMLPLAEIAPELMVGQYRAKHLANNCRDQGVVKL
jgi:2-amino-4-hydroxy-6-hydroxymethyldihydropteridine diphosphokinase